MSRPKPTAERGLRARAEAVVRGTEAEIDGLSSAQIQRVVHELEVHQIELQLQNEELRRVQTELAESRDRLANLYDFAPVGYLTLDNAAVIVQANLTAAAMLGVHRQRLVGKQFTRFVSAADQDILYRHRAAMGDDTEPRSCELRLRNAGGQAVPVQLDSVAFDDPVTGHRGWRMTITNVAERIRARAAELARTIVLRRMISAQEHERQRIGRELHDLLGQRMTALRLNIERLKADQAGTPAAAGHVEAVAADLRELDRDMENVIRELRPPALADLGLAAALSNYTHRWSQQFDVPARLHAGSLDRLSPDVEVMLYRVAQEALTNTARHARATQVDLVLEQHAGRVSLIIEDDGVGFDIEAVALGSRLGLRGMSERAAAVGATLSVESIPGSGTTIIARVSLDANSMEGSGDG